MKNLWLQIEAYIEHAQLQAPVVSDKDVAWHLDHSLRVVIGIVQSMQKSDPAQYQPRFSLSKSYILWTGNIPRGKGRAPKAVVSTTDVTEEQVRALLQKAKEVYAELEGLSARHYFEHPYFGHLPLSKAKRFIDIHTKHHLKIIRDILKKAES